MSPFTISTIIKNLFIYFLFFVFSNCSNVTSKKNIELKYPALKPNLVSDFYYGKKIDDYYRFLENDSNSIINQWINQENSLCDSMLNDVYFNDSIKKNLEEVVYSSNIRGGFARAVGSRLFFIRLNVKEFIQKLYYRDSLSSKDIEIFTTESLDSKNGHYTIDFFEPSYDGKYIAFGISSNGNEMTQMKIIDVEKKILLQETIYRVPYGMPIWIYNENAFFYSQLKELNTSNDINTMYEDSYVKIHRLNTSSENDKIIFSKNNNKDLDIKSIDFSTVCTYPSSDKLIAYIERGSTLYKSIYYTPLNNFKERSQLKNIKWKNICTANEKITTFTLNHNQFYAISFKNNPNGTLKLYDLTTSQIKESVILEEKEGVLEDIIQTKNSLYIKKIKNGISSIIQIDLTSGKTNIVTLPFNGYVNLKPFFDVPTSYLHSSNLYFSMESWGKEIGIYSYNPNTKEILKTDLRVQGKFGAMKDIVVEEIEIISHDGVLVPLSIIYLKGTKLNGNNPTLLEAYGAYGISMNSSFYLPRLTWLKMGGIYAVAHVRGGGEKGDSWYKGGYKATKSNSWKDFISCAEFLIAKKYTSEKKLAAKGTSAGGITIGRAITERPELFKAAILEVSELNTLRSESSHNTFAVSEFGTIKDSLEFNYLYEMDVYHHIKKNIKYPALLITAGLSDARVDWWQPAKAVALFQKYAKENDNPILFKINNTGHSGDPDIVREESNYYSFLLWQLNH